MTKKDKNKDKRIKQIAYRLCKIAEKEMDYYLWHSRSDLQKRFVKSLRRIINNQ